MVHHTTNIQIDSLKSSRRDPEVLKKLTISSVDGRMSLCVWHITRASNLSSHIVDLTAERVLCTLLKVRSASAVDTGNTAST